MSLQFPCPCGRVLQVTEDLAGKRVRCPSCSRIVWAPAEAERVPEARLVDAPQAPKAEPAAAKVPEPPMASPVPVAASPAPEPGRCCGVRHDCGAVGGFVVSLGSLVFGVVTTLFPLSWPVGGSVGALISCGALRRIRAGRANPASAGLARAGAAIGLGQAIVGLVMWGAIFTLALPGHHGCGRPPRIAPPPSVAPAPVAKPAQKAELPNPDRGEEEDEAAPAKH